MKKIIWLISAILLFLVIDICANSDSYVRYKHEFVPITKTEFCIICNKNNIPDIHNWCQRIYLDKDTGKYYSKYLWRDKSGDYLLLKEEKTNNLLFTKIEKGEE